MLTVRHDPFPFEAVRDLLGILRALYAAAPEKSRQRGAIAAVAGELRQAVELASAHETGTLGHAAAWQRAERATARVADLVDVTTPLEPVLTAARARVRR